MYTHKICIYIYIIINAHSKYEVYGSESWSKQCKCMRLVSFDWLIQLHVHVALVVSLSPTNSQSMAESFQQLRTGWSDDFPAYLADLMVQNYIPEPICRKPHLILKLTPPSPPTASRNLQPHVNPIKPMWVYPFPKGPIQFFIAFRRALQSLRQPLAGPIQSYAPSKGSYVGLHGNFKGPYIALYSPASEKTDKTLRVQRRHTFPADAGARSFGKIGMP